MHQFSTPVSHSAKNFMLAKCRTAPHFLHVRVTSYPQLVGGEFSGVHVIANDLVAQALLSLTMQIGDGIKEM